MLGVIFFFRQNETFYLRVFDAFFLYQPKGIVVLNSNLKNYFTYDNFS